MKNRYLTATLAITAALVVSLGAHSQDAKFKDTVRIPVYNVPDSDFVDYVFGRLWKSGYGRRVREDRLHPRISPPSSSAMSICPRPSGHEQDLITKTLESGSVKMPALPVWRPRKPGGNPTYVGDCAPVFPTGRRSRTRPASRRSPRRPPTAIQLSGHAPRLLPLTTMNASGRWA